MLYQLEFKRSVAKDIQNLPQSVLSRIRAAIEELAEDPYPSGYQKIKGYEGYYRIRIGRYRVVYEVQEVVRVICVIKIGHRKDIYRKL